MITHALERMSGRALLLLGILPGVASCSEGPDPQPPFDASTMDNAVPRNDVAPDAAVDATDGGLSADGGDGAVDEDAAIADRRDGPTCTCTPPDGGGFPAPPGDVESLACLCNQRNCPSYDDAIKQCPFVFPGSTNKLVLHTYAACDLVMVERRWGFDTSFEVYRASTHEMVGAHYATDTDTFTCGSTTVFALRAGTFPAATCVDVTTTLCPTDAGADGDAPPPQVDATPDVDDGADGGDGAVTDIQDGSTCACTPPEGGTTLPPPAGEIESLACLCTTQRICPSYETAVKQCPFPGGTNQLLLHTYANCDLVMVERRWGFDTSFEVYKASTHEMVGAYYSTDVPNYTCGSTPTFAIRAGTFPAASCTDVSTMLCTTDAGPGGDAPATQVDAIPPTGDGAAAG